MGELKLIDLKDIEIERENTREREGTSKNE